MRIVACVKHVPDLLGDRGFTDDGRVDRAVDGTLSELDEHAVEAALQLTESAGGDVTVLTVGPRVAASTVRRGLQMGAAHGVHVLDDAIEGSDVFGTARVLAGAIRTLGEQAPVDLVVTGMGALDGLTSVVPSLLAAMLGLPQATLAADVTVLDGRLRVRRDLDMVEVVEAPLPAVLSVTDQANTPRQPSFPTIVAARSIPVTTWSSADVGVDPAQVGHAGARTRVVEAVPRPPRTDRVLITDEGDAGSRLAALLAERGLLP